MPGKSMMETETTVKHGLTKLLALPTRLLLKPIKEEVELQLADKPPPKQQVAESVLLVPKHRADPKQEAEVPKLTPDIQQATISLALHLPNKNKQIQPLPP